MTYAAKLIGTEPATLRQLAIRAVQASKAVSQGYADDLDEAEMDRREDEAFEARRALLDHLLTNEGIGSALARSLGEVL